MFSAQTLRWWSADAKGGPFRFGMIKAAVLKNGNISTRKMNRDYEMLE